MVLVGGGMALAGWSDGRVPGLRVLRMELTARMWRDFGEYCGLPLRAVASLAGALCAALPDACALVERSFLVPEQQHAYARLLNERALVLAELARRS